MKTHTLVQGSPEWAVHRRQFFNASDAPAMMNCSAYKTRDQLLHEMHTGLAKEVDAATQRRFDDGHRFEALARPLAVNIIGEQLFPVVGSEGKLSASFDGLTMGEDTAFEHKSLNDELRAAIPEGDLGAGDSETGGALPLQYRVQMEQQLMVSGAERVLFMASKWNGDELLEERHCWYDSDPALRARILSGWEQFDQDLCAYIPPAAAASAPTGRAPETLPALLITVKGEVTDSNLANFKEVALTAIRSVNRELTTDQHFADADKAVKWCSDIEERVAGAKQHALSQTATIDQLFKALDDISAEARQTRLDLKKLVEARKISLKTEMLTEKQTELGDFLRAKNAALGRDYMPRITADFAGAIHGKKNFDSMRSALNGELARAKIEANAVADKILRNLNVLADKAKDHDFLFNDKATLVQMENDHFALMVDKRISDHVAAKQAEEERTRERIRAEEQAKAEKDSMEKLAREAEAQRIADAETARANAATELAEAKASPEGAELSPAAQALNEREGAARFAAAHPGLANVVPMRAAAPAPAAAPMTPPTMKLGDINTLLAPIALSVDGLTKLGFPPAATQQNAKLYHHRDLPRICTALHDLLDKVQAQQAA